MLFVVGDNGGFAPVYVHELPEIVTFALERELSSVVEIMHGVKRRNVYHRIYRRFYEIVFHTAIIHLFVVLCKRISDIVQENIRKNDGKSLCDSMANIQKRIIPALD